MVGAGGNVTYTLSGGSISISGDLITQGDGRYRGVATLADLNYVGNDVLVEIRLQKMKLQYLDQRTITIAGDNNTASVVNITTPASDSSYDSGMRVTLSCSAADVEDGDLSVNCKWMSTLDSNLGTGRSISVVLSDGAHSITASVADSATRTASDSITVTVGTVVIPINLTATGYKVKGKQRVDLSWNDATSTQVEIFRDGVLIANAANSGTYSDNIGKKGGGTYAYRVCEVGSTRCSADVSVVF